MMANGDTWKPKLQQKDGFDYIVDHFKYSGTETPKDTIGLSRTLGKEKGIITKNDWTLFYRSVEKQSGISILDWKPPKGVESGQMVPKATYDDYLEAMMKKGPKGNTTVTYVYINCANLKKNDIDLKGKRPENIPEDVWDGIQATIKKAGKKFKEGKIDEILSTPALSDAYDPLVGTHD